METWQYFYLSYVLLYLHMWLFSPRTDNPILRIWNVLCATQRAFKDFLFLIKETENEILSFFVRCVLNTRTESKWLCNATERTSSAENNTGFAQLRGWYIKSSPHLIRQLQQVASYEENSSIIIKSRDNFKRCHPINRYLMTSWLCISIAN